MFTLIFFGSLMLANRRRAIKRVYVSFSETETRARAVTRLTAQQESEESPLVAAARRAVRLQNLSDEAIPDDLGE